MWKKQQPSPTRVVQGFLFDMDGCKKSGEDVALWWFKKGWEKKIVGFLSSLCSHGEGSKHWFGEF